MEVAVRLVRGWVNTVGGKQLATLLLTDETVNNGLRTAVHVETGLSVIVRADAIKETIWMDTPKLSGERKVIFEYDPNEPSEHRWTAVAEKDGSPCYDAVGRTPEEAAAGLAETLWANWVDDEEIDGG